MATKIGGRTPRAVIHKRILEAAESDPGASLEALAGEIAGASPDLVERVLEEYGDPGELPAEATTAEDHPMSDPARTPTAAELTEKQRETLRAIAAAPEATQSELAEALSVSRATVNKRLNDIDGFDWADREAFVETVLDADAGTRSPEPAGTSDADGDTTPEADAPSPTGAAVDGGQLLDPDGEAAVEQLQERVARLEQQLGDAAADGSAPGIDDTELLAKVLRAVMAADDIDEAEEVAVLEALR